MIARSVKEIEEQVKKLWPAESYDHQDVKVEVYKGGASIEISRMYDPPGLSFDILNNLSEFFGTDEISDSSFSSSGCETCDYGSKYGFTLYIGMR